MELNTNKTNKNPITLCFLIIYNYNRGEGFILNMIINNSQQNYNSYKTRINNYTQAPVNKQI